jgi:predicted ribosome quality control (RQC) complex YloA/Tae2 family protein
MKKEISALEIHFLIKEWGLKGAKFDKIFQYKDNFSFKMHIPNKGKIYLNFLNKILFFSDKKIKTSIHPPGFCMFLRKYLSNSRISEVNQLTFERIIEFKTNKGILLIELFGKNNLALCDENYKIIGTYRPANMSREFKKGEIYPVEKKPNPFENLDELEEPIGKSLATKYSLGGKYSNYILHQLNLEKTAKPTTHNKEKIFSFLKKFEPEPSLKEKEFALFNQKNSKLFKTLSEILTTILEPELEEKVKDKQETIVKQQTKQLTKLKENIVSSKEAAEKIYEHYILITEIIKDIKNAKKYKQVKEVNYKKKQLILEL